MEKGEQIDKLQVWKEKLCFWSLRLTGYAVLYNHSFLCFGAMTQM